MHGGKIRNEFGGFFGGDKMGHDYRIKGILKKENCIT